MDPRERELRHVRALVRAAADELETAGNREAADWYRAQVPMEPTPYFAIKAVRDLDMEDTEPTGAPVRKLADL